MLFGPAVAHGQRSQGKPLRRACHWTHTPSPLLPATAVPAAPGFCADSDGYTIVYDPNTRESTEEVFFFATAIEVRRLLVRWLRRRLWAVAAVLAAFALGCLRARLQPRRQCLLPPPAALPKLTRMHNPVCFTIGRATTMWLASMWT